MTADGTGGQDPRGGGGGGNQLPLHRGHQAWHSAPWSPSTAFEPQHWKVWISPLKTEWVWARWVWGHHRPADTCRTAQWPPTSEQHIISVLGEKVWGGGCSVYPARGGLSRLEAHTHGTCPQTTCRAQPHRHVWPAGGGVPVRVTSPQAGSTQPGQLEPGTPIQPSAGVHRRFCA